MIEKVRFGEAVIAVLKDMKMDGYNVIAILKNFQDNSRLIIPGKNIVTNDGDLYYAQKAAGEAADVSYVGVRLGTDNTAPTKADTDVTAFAAGTGKATAASYPQSDDQDAENTGAAVDSVTWKFTYTTAEGNATGIEEGAIVDSISAPTKALAHFLFAAPFDKTSSNTLTVFVNHNFLGV